MSRALINNMSVEDFLNDMFDKEQRGEDIRELRELWYDHTTEWKYSDYDIIESVAKYVDKGGESYRGEFYKEIHDLIYCGWNVEDMVDSINYFYKEWKNSKEFSMIPYINYKIVMRIVYDIINESGDDEMFREFCSISIAKESESGK